MLSCCWSGFLHLLHSCLPVADAVSVLSSQNGFLHSDTPWTGHLRTSSLLGRRHCVVWVAWVVLLGRRLLVEKVVWVVLSWRQLDNSCSRDAVRYVIMYCLVRSFPSSFAWSQIACNLARANLMCFVFAVMTACCPPCWFFDFVRASIDSWVLSLTCGYFALGSFRMPSFVFATISRSTWFSCRRRSARGRLSSRSGCGTSSIHVVFECSVLPT